MANFKATWSGKYPCLCVGEWTLYLDGVDVSDVIPQILRISPMGTRKEYAAVRFDENCNETYEYYWDGLSAKKWIRKNLYWVTKICKTWGEAFELYHAINDADWRHSSCGGCL